MREPSDQTSFAAASPASPSASRGSARRKLTRAGSGRISRQLSIWSAHQSCLSRTSRGCGGPACVTCWPILPLSGSMRNGVISGLPRSVLRIDDSVCSFLPTPTATAFDNNIGGGSGRVGKKRLSLGSMARRGLLPTPTVKGDYNRAGASAASGDGLATVIGGPLNPQFREWLMGFPVGWTDIVSLVTPASRRKPPSHGEP